MIKILFICHGNICRSPMAEFVMADLVKKAGLAGKIEVASAATSTEEIGNGVHYGTRQKLAQMGVPCGEHRAVQVVRADYERYDYLIVMDSNNMRNLKRIVGEDRAGKVKLLLDFTKRAGMSIADPWYTGNFDETYVDILEGCSGLLRFLMSKGAGVQR